MIKLILQLDLDVTLELVIFGEQCYDRDLGIPCVNPNSYSCILTYHSYLGKYDQNASSLAMADHYPLGCKT